MNNKLLAVLIVLAMITTGAITYAVVETGKELKCATNKPIGWEITATHETYYEATCNYMGKEPVKALCSSFRKTSSYERYWCKEIELIEQEIKNPEIITGLMYCDTKGECIIH